MYPLPVKGCLQTIYCNNVAFVLQLTPVLSTHRPLKALFFLRLNLVSMLLFASTPALASEPLNLYRFKLENLDSFSSFDTESLLGKQSLWILFQPNCASCKKQMDDLQCLPASIVKVAVGFGGNPEQLRKELLPSKFQGKRVLATPRLRRVLNTEATPSLFLVNEAGQSLKVIQGATSCERLKSEFAHLK
jgi:hypothetical protein